MHKHVGWPVHERTCKGRQWWEMEVGQDAGGLEQ